MIASEMFAMLRERSLKSRQLYLSLEPSGSFWKSLLMNIRKECTKSRNLMRYSLPLKITSLFFHHKKLPSIMRLSEKKLRVGRIFCKLLVRHWKCSSRSNDNGFTSRLYLILSREEKMIRRSNWWEISINLKKQKRNSKNIWLSYTKIPMPRELSAKKGYSKTWRIWAKN